MGPLLDGGGLHLLGVSARHRPGPGRRLRPRRPRRSASGLSRLGWSHRRRLAPHPDARPRPSLRPGPVRGGGGGRGRHLHAGHHAARRALRAGAARLGHGLVPRRVVARLRARPGGGRRGGGAPGMAGRALRACPGTGSLLRALARALPRRSLAASEGARAAAADVRRGSVRQPAGPAHDLGLRVPLLGAARHVGVDPGLRGGRPYRPRRHPRARGGPRRLALGDLPRDGHLRLRDGRRAVRPLGTHRGDRGHDAGEQRVLVRVRLDARSAGAPHRARGKRLRLLCAWRFVGILHRNHGDGEAGAPRLGASRALAPRIRRGGGGADRLWALARSVRRSERGSGRLGLGLVRAGRGRRARARLHALASSPPRGAAARGREALEESGPQGGSMATVLFIVKATIPRKKEAAFNRWYNNKHCPQLLRYPGAVSARRYKAIMGEDKYRHMAVYEVKDERTFRALMKSDHMKALRRDYDRWFGKVSERARFAYTQVWP